MGIAPGFLLQKEMIAANNVGSSSKIMFQQHLGIYNF
jgi:hypothetical protein